MVAYRALIIAERSPGHRHHYADEKADALTWLASLVEIIVNPPKGNVIAIADASGRFGTQEPMA
jgi:hypothetical protein